ncbi:MAG: hypothetical protein KGL39_43895 [Patescibacteria group bacterium]|nr:hypothetical protein [Patescibacteria group bacterium]
MQQPTQPVAQRRSAVFTPGQGWGFTPQATMATSPPNQTTSSTSYAQIVAVDPLEDVFITCGPYSAAGNYGTASSGFVTLKFPNYVVPSGYKIFVAVCPLNQPFLDQGFFTTGAVGTIGITYQALAYLNAGTSGAGWYGANNQVPANAEITGWEVQVNLTWYCVAAPSAPPQSKSLQVNISSMLMIVPTAEDV